LAQAVAAVGLVVAAVAGLVRVVALADLERECLHGLTQHLFSTPACLCVCVCVCVSCAAQDEAGMASDT
jgi:hypothetical protein